MTRTPANKCYYKNNANKLKKKIIQNNKNLQNDLPPLVTDPVQLTKKTNLLL